MENDIVYCCIDCGNLICKRTALYGQGRCKSCANKVKINNGIFDKHFKSLKGKGNPRYNGGKPHCVLCDKQLTSYRTRYCESCFPKSRKNKPRTGKPRFGKNAPCYKDGRSLKITNCKICKKEISWKSKMCYKCWSSQNVGKNNGNYIHGQGNTPYPLAFSNKLKLKIRTRDNFICQKCGLKEEKHYLGGKQIKLTIHHIDYNKFNCNESNLITLCHKCNIQANFYCDYWYAFYKYTMNNIKDN